MKKTNYSIKKLFKKGIATLLTASMVVTAVQAPAFADNVDEEVTESSASVTGLVNKKITLELVSDELKEAALTAIRENRLFDAQDYLAATGDNQKALREYEAFFNENPGLYVVDAPESVVDTLSGEDAELRIFVQKDAKMAKVDLTASPSEITREDSTESKNVEFRYGTDKDIILYEPASNVDTLVNGGEDAYYIEPEQEIGDNSDYELTGNEKITFMFVNSSEGTVRFTLKVDGVTYDKVEVGGREAALKKIVAEAGTKKSTEETTVAETTVAETTTAAVTAVTEETTVADETTAAEVQEVETEAPAEETTAEGTEIANADADNVSAETEETIAAVEETAAETEAPAAVEAEVKEEAPAEVAEESETEATIPEKIAEAISEAFGGASDAVLGRMTVYADTIVGEGVEFEVEENAPAAGDSEEEEDKDTNEVVAEAVEAAAGEDTTTEADEVNEETTAAVEEAADDNTALAADTTALQIEVSEGLSEDEAENQVEETAAQEVTVVETEPETVAETEAPKETIAKDDETKAAKVATASEIAEYDDFALELIAEVKEEVLQDKETAKENIKVARIAQYTINELGKVHYETEVDGFNVEVFAAKNAFGDITPTLEAKKLAKPEEAEASEDKLSDNQVAELKANNIYDNSQSLDIHFLDGFGKEVEPSETVKVRITLSDENLLKTIDATSLEVHHIKETNDTLKTEKVAETEDVKLLNKNDEQISDSDLQASAEAVAAGEEVEVVSAVADFEVESFSIFTITWNDRGLREFKVTLKYVTLGENGQYTEIYNNSKDNSLDLSEGTIMLTDERFGLSLTGGKSYKYKTATVGDTDIKNHEIAYIKTTTNGNTSYVSYFNKNNVEIAKDTAANFIESETGLGAFKDDKYTNTKRQLYVRTTTYEDGVVEEDGHYYKLIGNEPTNETLYYKSNGSNKKFKEYKGSRYSYQSENTVFLIYEEVTNPHGGDPQEQELDAPLTSKKIVPNGDGTHKLTLSVTGKANSSETQTQTSANVLIVLDTSKSMLGKVKNYVEDNTVANNILRYGLTSDGEYKKLYKESKSNVWRWLEGPDVGKEYTGTRYKLVEGTATRLDVAKSAINILAKDLGNDIDMALITFDSDATVETTHKTNPAGIASALENINSNTGSGTNWEAALIAADGFDFEDKDPVYIVFLSDGEPNLRVSTQVQGSSSDKNWQAAKNKVDEIVNTSNKQFYAISTFGTVSKMRDLVDDKDYYKEAKDIDELTKVFITISNIIKNNLSYCNVKIDDGITNLTSTMEVLGLAGDYRYEITKKEKGEDGKERVVPVATHEQLTSDEDFADLKDKIMTAKYVHDENTNKSSVVWPLGGEEDGVNFKLEDGYTYSVSFTIWPKQEAYDMVADAYNGMYSEADMEAQNFVNVAGEGEKPEWEYITNTNAKVYYQTVNTITVNGNSNETVSPDLKSSDIPQDKDNPWRMKLSSTDIGVEKLWRMDDYETQKDYISEDSITLQLHKKNSEGEFKPVKFKEKVNDKEVETSDIWINSTTSEQVYSVDSEGNPALDEDGNLMVDKNGDPLLDEEGEPIVIGTKWTTSRRINIAPGILLIVNENNKARFKHDGKEPTKVTFNGTEYYMLETGHDYKFHEKSDVEEFTLHEKIYHPMLVDNVLHDVTLNGNTITSMVPMGSVGSETITAENIFKALKVTKVYTGNMAAPQETTFRLHLYDENGTQKSIYKDVIGNDGNVVYNEDGTPKKYDVFMELNEDVERVYINPKNPDLGYVEGLYEFKITPTKLDDITSEEATKVIALPQKTQYSIEEIKEGKPYSNYKVRWGTEIINEETKNIDVKLLTEGNTTSKTVLNKGWNPIYFANEMTAVTPTGFGDNAIPFVALAIAGLSAMVFLAYDFQKRRLFED